MSRWDWIKGAIGLQRDTPVEVTESREIARRIGEHADTLNEHLKTYQRSRDPFAALMADLYNRDQLSRLHKSIKP